MLENPFTGVLPPSTVGDPYVSPCEQSGYTRFEASSTRQRLHNTLPEGEAFGPDDVAWSYEATERESFFAPFVSGADHLANGNTFVCSGPQGSSGSTKARSTAMAGLDAARTAAGKSAGRWNGVVSSI